MQITILSAEKPRMQGKVTNIFTIAIMAEGAIIKINGVKAFDSQRGGTCFALPSECKFNFETRQREVNHEGKTIYVPIVEIENSSFQNAMSEALKEYESKFAEKSKEQAQVYKTPMPKAQAYDDCPF